MAEIHRHNGLRKNVSHQQRFEEGYVRIPESGCWIWIAAMSDGYGHFMVNGKLIKAHRYAYEQKHGPIPEGLQIDHLCRVRCCVNPAHLEAVTQQENMERGKKYSNNHSRDKTHCPQGHPYSGDNLYIMPNGGRQCRICKNQSVINYRLRQKTTSAAQSCGG